MATGLQALICPQCSGEVELDNNQEYGFCKYCGTKVQNTNFMKVKGNVKIDNSEQVERFLLNARRAKSKEDWEEVEKYYNLVEQNDPTNIEAIFYSAYGKCMLALYDENIFKREQKFDVLRNSISVLDDNFDINNIEEDLDTIYDIYNDIVKMENKKFVSNVRTVGESGLLTVSDASKTRAMFASVFNAFIESVENILQRIDETKVDGDTLFDLYTLIASAYERYVGNETNFENKVKLVDKLNRYYGIMNQINPKFQKSMPVPVKPKKSLTGIKGLDILLKIWGIGILVTVFIALFSALMGY